MARTIGIDLGAYTVKLSIFEGSLGRYQLADYRVRRVQGEGEGPPGLPARLEALEALLSEEASKDRTLFAAAFPAEQASLRTVNLPFTDRAQVEKTLPFEIEGLVPFDMEDMVLCSRITSQDGGRTEVLTALAARDRVGPLLSGLAAAGADPKHLVIDADLLGHYGSSGVQAVVDIGHVRTVLALVVDGKVAGARAIDGGGRDLTAALARAFGLDWEDAEGRKHVARLVQSEHAPAAAAVVEWEEEELGADDLLDDGENTEDLPVVQPLSQVRLDPSPEADVLRQALGPLVAELRASLIAFEDGHGVEIGELLLAGGTSELGGLAAWLEADLGVPVRRVRVSDHAEALGDPGRFALSHVLGLKAGNATRGREMELRAGDFGFRGDLAVVRNVALVGVAAAVAFMCIGVGLFAWRSVQIEAELNEVEKEIGGVVSMALPDVDPSLLADPSRAVAIMQENAAENQARVEALGAITSTTPPTLSLLKDISDSVPPPGEARIDLAELNITPTSVVLKGATDGYEDATEIEAALQENARFKQARKGDEKKKRDGIQFTITIPLDEGDESEEG